MNFKGQIFISTTGTLIVPYGKHQSKYLEKITSTYDEVRHRRNEITGYYIEDDPGIKSSCFITYLHGNQFIQSLFPDYEIVELPKKIGRKLSEDFALNADITPTDVQYGIIHEIINSSVNRHQWFVYLSQGYGKTLLSVYLISIFHTRALIMCYSTEILLQWMKTFNKKTTINMSRVLLIDSSALLTKIYKNTFPTHEYDIFMCTPKLLTGYGAKYGYTRIPNILEKMGVGVKIFDEAHRNIANIVKINAFTSIDKTIYLSGDFGQSNPVKEKLYYAMFHSVQVIKPPEDVINTLKYTVAIIMEYDSEPTPTEITSVYTRRGFSFYNYMKYQFKKKIFFDTLYYILDIIHRTNTGGYKTLILVNLISQCDELYDLITTQYGDKHRIGKFHGKVSEEHKEFSREYADIIIATYQSFGTGIDVSSIKYVVSTSVCTKIDDNQAAGRARPLSDGSDAFYFMMCDRGFLYSLKKLKERIRYLIETKIKDVKRMKYV